MAVKIGNVYAGEFRLAADGQAAAAAHAGPVDHDRIHADSCFDAVLFGKFANKLHHNQRPDRNDFVVLLALLDKLFKRVRDKALCAVGAVVRLNDKSITDGFELILKNHQIFISKADNGVNLRAKFVQFFGHQIGNRAADAAADHGHFF